MPPMSRNRPNGMAPSLGIAAALLLAAGAFAEAPELQSLIDAERAFARRSVEQGMRSAFLEYLTPDAVLFRAGPVNGRQMWQGRRESPAQLAWTPSL